MKVCAPLVASTRSKSRASLCASRRLYADPGQLGRFAIASLHGELVCAPKPGLVTPFDTGSHGDMDATTFMRSLFALRGYFLAIAEAGAEAATFTRLKQLGIDAEAAMSRATGGINTHRGAIFSLGLLVAAAASLRTQGADLSADSICHEVRLRWGAPIGAAAERATSASHGQLAARRYGVGGARHEAAEGFPTLISVAIPVLRRSLCNRAQPNAALVQTLMTLVATTDDTNLLHRGGKTGLAYAQRQARAFLGAGGIASSGWEERLALIGREFVARRLSPGGSADLLACAWFLMRVEQSDG
jgi:triphosphoribosyl-dephospho-CoA synthase